MSVNKNIQLVAVIELYHVKNKYPGPLRHRFIKTQKWKYKTQTQQEWIEIQDVMCVHP